MRFGSTLCTILVSRGHYVEDVYLPQTLSRAHKLEVEVSWLHFRSQQLPRHGLVPLGLAQWDLHNLQDQSLTGDFGSQDHLMEDA